MKRSFTITLTAKKSLRLALFEDGIEVGFALCDKSDYDFLYEQGTDFVGEIGDEMLGDLNQDEIDLLPKVKKQP